MSSSSLVKGASFATLALLAVTWLFAGGSPEPSAETSAPLAPTTHETSTAVRGGERTPSSRSGDVRYTGPTGHRIAAPARFEGDASNGEIVVASAPLLPGTGDVDLDRVVEPAVDQWELESDVEQAPELPSVDPAELGFDNAEQLEAVLADRLGIPDGYRVRLVHESREGRDGVRILVEPQGDEG